MDKALNILDDINNEIGFIEGHTQIVSTIEGFDVDIRVFVQDKSIIRFDMFNGRSERKFRNRIEWRAQ